MQHYSLIKKLTLREVKSRYQGSLLGVFWSLLNPILMLSIYTIVFSQIFQMRWGGTDDNKTMFAVMVFSGMLVLSFFAEVLNRAPSLILNHVNYVKKVVFPLHTLSIVSVAVAAFQVLMNLLIMLIALMVLQGSISITIVYVPLILAPLMILSLGLSWFISAFGVYFRDVGELVTAVTTVLMFLSPVFYPMSAVPAGLKPIILLNPLTFIIQQLRAVSVHGVAPDIKGLFVYTAIALLIALLGYLFFQKTRQGFADVL